MRAALTHTTVEELTSPQSLERLRPDWHALLAHCPTATPFQSPEWLIPWWTHFGRGVLWTLAVRRYGQLIGLAPFYRAAATPGARCILLLGTGITDHLDVLCDWRYVGETSARLMACLRGMQHLWHRCEFYNLPAHALLLRAPPPAGWTSETILQNSSPVLPLSGSLSSCLPAAQWKRLQRCRRRAARFGQVRLLHADHETYSDMFRVLLDLHTLAWRSRGRCGVLSRPAIQAFHHAAARGLLERQQLCLYILTVDGAPVAALYGFRAGSSVYLYLSGFDPQAAALSPGLLITGAVIEDALHSGARAVDFLAGREAYKYAWGAQDRPLYRRYLSAPAAPARAISRQQRGRAVTASGAWWADGDAVL